MSRPVFRQEVRTTLFAPSGLTVLLLLAALAIYAVVSGGAWREQRQGEMSVFLEAVGEQRLQWEEELAAFEAREDPDLYAARPMNVNVGASLPPGVLSDFTAGNADLKPYLATLRPWRNAVNVFEKHQFGNPTTLRLGRFDLAFVTVVLAPLFLIALLFDALATDRARGTLQLALAQGASLHRILWTRLLTRFGAVWLVLTAITAVAAAAGGLDGERALRALLWIAVSTLYLGFWLALAAWVISRSPTAEKSAATLAAAWGLLVLALPAALGAVSEALDPPPSHLAFLSAARTAQGDAARRTAELTEGFLMDHPDLTVSDDEVPAFYRAALLANRAVREETAPIVSAFEASRAGRRRTLDLLQYLAPPVLTLRTQQVLAGSDPHRQAAFESQVREDLGSLLDAVTPAVMSKKRISRAQYEALPDFVFRELPLRRLALGALPGFLFLAFLTAVLLRLVHVRLARLERGGLAS